MTELDIRLTHTHFMELVEQHEISVEPLTELDETTRTGLWADMTAAAMDWCDAQGVSAVVEEFVTADPYTVGVRFQVVVTRAVATPTGSDMQYRWSNRWRDWLEKFSALRRAEQHAPAHPVARGAGARVIPMKPV